MIIYLVTALDDPPRLAALLERESGDVLISFAAKCMRGKTTMFHNNGVPNFTTTYEGHLYDHLPGAQPE